MRVAFRCAYANQKATGVLFLLVDIRVKERLQNLMFSVKSGRQVGRFILNLIIILF